jgi:hypothetical protein
VIARPAKPQEASVLPEALALPELPPAVEREVLER